MAKGLMEEGWEGFREKCVPPSAGSVQVRETQQAFYAGAGYLLAQLMLRLDPGAAPTDENMSLVDEVYAELVAFAKSKGG